MEVTASFAINFYANKDTQGLSSPASSEPLISFWPSLCITQRKDFTQQWPLDPVGLWERELRNTRDCAAHWDALLILLWLWGSGAATISCTPGNTSQEFPWIPTLHTVRRLNTRRRLKMQEDCQKLFTAWHCFHPSPRWSVPCHHSTGTLFQNSCVWPDPLSLTSPVPRGTWVSVFKLLGHKPRSKNCLNGEVSSQNWWYIHQSWDHLHV